MKLKTGGIQQRQKEVSELPLSEVHTAINFLFRTSFIPRKEKSKPTLIPSPGVFYGHEEGKITCTCMSEHYHRLSYLLSILLETPVLFTKETHLFFP